MGPETMFDAVANVGVKNGRIAIITKAKIAGKETIDATSHVVAPYLTHPVFAESDLESLKENC
jgi:N-acyl-D-amino-acid deacylase